jgi:hypothetical protein
MGHISYCREDKVYDYVSSSELRTEPEYEDIANELCRNVAKFKYLGITLTNQNDVHDEMKSRLNG